MKAIEYYDVIFVIENTASCGGYLNELKTSYIHPSLEYFCNGLLQEESTNLFGIVLFKTSQTAPLANCCTSYGPFSAQKFLKKVDELELTSGRGEQCANLVEGLATALVCFHDLEKRRENELSTQKHCILISNSPPYTMPVTECYEYEGKNLEQLAALFVEKNINLSIISPRKIPILYEIFEKSGGDLGLTAKNYSKDPRHLVLLKGFSLKELIHDKRPESPPAAQPTAAPPQMPPVPQPTPQQPPQTQQPQSNVPQMMPGGNEQQQQPQMVQMPQMGMPNQGMRPNIRPNQPMMQQATQQQQQQQNVMQGMGNPPQFSGPMGSFQGQQRPMAPNQPNQPRQQFMQGMMSVGGNMMNPNQPSALISQLNQPPSVGPANPMANTMRMPMVNQPQNQPMMQNQPQNPQMMVQNQQNPGMMQNQSQNPNMQMQNQQMMAANQQKQGMMQNQAQNPNMPMQNPQMMVQNQQNPGMMQNQPNQGMQNSQMMPPRERIWVGILEWNDKQNQQNQVRQVPCEIYASMSKETNEPEIRGDTWPNRLIMQLMPKTVISNVGGQMLRDARVVQFQWGNSEAFESLSKVMANGFAGCVHFTGHQQCDVKILILLYMQDKKSYYGFVPNDQSGYVEKLRRVIQQSKITQFGQNPGPQQPQQQAQQPPQQQQQMQGQVRPMMGMGQPNMPGNQNMMQGDQSMMFNQQRMARPNMMPTNNNLRHLLQQQQTQFRPQMGGPQQGAPGQMQQGRPGFDGMDPQFDMNFQMN